MIQTEVSYMLHGIDGDTYNVVMLDPAGPLDALNYFKGSTPDDDEYIITDITVHYERLVGPGMGELTAWE